jgi:eukaryotic-like serine/threonine-protein kinase
VSQEQESESLAWAATLLVEEVCNHYEKAWRSGRRPHIEDFVAGRARAERSLLLRELVSLEIEYCRRGGEERTPAEFIARFPMLDPDWLASLMSNRPEEPPSRLRATNVYEEKVDSHRGATCPPGPAERLPTIAEPAGHILVSALANDIEAPDRYTLTRLHATGGIGRVWLARDQRLGREIALKELRP